MKKLFFAVALATVSVANVSAQFTTSENGIYYTGGNVGIGRTNPTGRLAVSVNIAKSVTSSSNVLTLTTNETTGQFGLFVNIIGASTLGNRSVSLFTGDLNSAAGGNIILQNSSGNVGIGTATPSEKLHVQGNILTNAENTGIIVDTGTNRRIGLMKYSDREAGIWRVAGQDFEIGRTSTSSLTAGIGTPTVDLYIAGTGNVGIGTTTPSAKLTVAGMILAQEVKVITDVNAVPDYVFKPGYELMPLEEVEAYVKENSHLPNVPSSQQVSEEGLKLQEMNLKLLEKVEELTLYLIELNTVVKEQSAKIEELKKKK